MKHKDKSMRFWKNKVINAHSALLTFALVTLTIFGFSGRDIKKNEDAYKELEKLTDILTLIENNYVEEVNIDDLFLGAINGMMDTLDSHSSFMPPDVYKDMQVETQGEFGGLGIEVTIRKRRLVVIAPIENTPAYRAGIQALDWIVKVDGKPTQDMTLMEAVDMMRGEKGTEVNLSIMRKGFKEPRDYTIVRGIIKLKNISFKKVEEDIGYIKISQFQERTAKELEDTLKNLSEKGCRGFIIDLRNNPGGLLEQAVSVADVFLDKGKIIVSTKGRLEDQNKDFLAATQPTSNDYPLVILVNAGSASASEIVAGAIKDWSRGVIIGEKTFGKGSVQTVIPLSNDAGLRLTTAHYYTPKGTNIHAKGILPDIVVDDTEMILNKTTEDEKKEIHILREKELRQIPSEENKREEDEQEDNEEKIEEPISTKEQEPELKDISLARAIDVIRATLIFKQSKKMDASIKDTPFLRYF
jgi:carboxyl-terminal processing protease